MIGIILLVAVLVFLVLAVWSHFTVLKPMRRRLLEAGWTQWDEPGVAKMWLAPGQPPPMNLFDANQQLDRNEGRQ